MFHADNLRSSESATSACTYALCLGLLGVPAFLPEDLSAHSGSRHATQDRF